MIPIHNMFRLPSNLSGLQYGISQEIPRLPSTLRLYYLSNLLNPQFALPPLPYQAPNYTQMLNLLLPSFPVQKEEYIESPLTLSSKSQLVSPSEITNQSQISKEADFIGLPRDPEICFEAQVKHMIRFFINNYGIISNQELEKAKARYEKDAKLTAIFEALERKYSVANKTREEMIKWIVRRSMKSSQQNLRGSQNKRKKELLKDLCKKYFTDNEGKKTQKDTSDVCDDDWVDQVLPFRKSSKNKTINSTFITELFQSQEFKQDYESFLKDFDEIAEAENAEKIQRFSKMIILCSKKGNMNGIIKHKRVPWLKLWFRDTKVIAREFREGNFTGRSSKIQKTIAISS